MKFLSVKLPDGIKQYLQEQANEFEVSISDIVRSLLKEQIGIEKWNELKNPRPKNLNL